MSAEDDLRALIARIEATFGRDIDAWLACFEEPVVVVAPQGTMTFADRAAAREFFGRMYDGLAARGFSSTGADDVRVRVVGDDIGFVDAEFTRRRADGSELERVAAIYVCRRSGDGWRVATLVSRPPDARLLDSASA
jgi:ketosteroid isomerase-like protein